MSTRGRKRVANAIEETKVSSENVSKILVRKRPLRSTPLATAAKGNSKSKQKFCTKVQDEKVCKPKEGENS